jgi:phospholipid/cholesterol/gamma-HCH transport system substrate-binding protein
MGRFTTSAKVGLFAVATGAAGLFIFRFVDKERGSAGGYVVHTYFDDASGIAKHSQVKVAGIAVGNIESVRLEKGKARIDIRMKPDVPLHVDASASKISSSLLGEYYLGIATGTEGRPLLKDGDEIPVVVEGVTTDSLMRDLSDISADVKRVTKALADSVGTDEGKENLKDTLENLARVTEALNQTVRENRESVHNILVNVDRITQNGEPEMRRILENVRESTSDIRSMLAKPEVVPTTDAAGESTGRADRDSIGGSAGENNAAASQGLVGTTDATRPDGKNPEGPVARADGKTDGKAADQQAGAKTQGGEVRRILEKVDRASSSLESTLSHLDKVTERLEKGEGTLGRLSKDEKLIDEVEGVTQTVGEFVGGLSRLQTIVTLRTDYQYLSSSVKSYLQLRLQPREDKYYLFEVVYDPRGATQQQQISVETTNPNQPPVYFERRTVTTNSARFSIQFAQRFGPFTGRFGIKESTGGGGLDLNLFDDRFELQQDVYGFGEVVLPRYRLSLGYEFVKRLWLLGGSDDILSSARRDYFVGLQLRFNDEDLKGILPFMPSGATN